MSGDPQLEDILASHCQPHPVPEGLREAIRAWARCPPQSPPPLAPPQRYALEGDLGEGGMGAVSLVRDRVLGRAVALKRLHRSLSGRPDILMRFVEEAQVTAQLEHPGILPLYDLGQLSDGQWYYTMPVIRGRTLAHVIADAHDQGPPSAPARRHLVGSSCGSARRWPTPTGAGSSTGTSNPPISWWAITARSQSSTGGSPSCCGTPRVTAPRCRSSGPEAGRWRRRWARWRARPVWPWRSPGLRNELAGSCSAT